MYHKVYIGIGSNKGHRRAYCAEAVKGLNKRAEVTVVARAAWREYPALTLNPDDVQPNFINGVIEVTTTSSPEVLLEICKNIEFKLGRPLQREKWGARVIDLDILSYDDLVYATDEITLPHPELHKRKFVLVGLTEIAPEWKHPLLGKTAEELLEKLNEVQN